MNDVAMCRLLGCDVYSFDFKINHIARHIQLPAPPHLGPGAKSLPDAEQIPPLLVLNIQLPMYPVRPYLPAPAMSCSAAFLVHDRCAHGAQIGDLITRLMTCVCRHPSLGRVMGMATVLCTTLDFQRAGSPQ